MIYFVQEYPYHLIELKKLAQTDAERDQYSAELALFLSDLRTFMELFSREFSEILLRYWREVRRMQSKIYLIDTSLQTRKYRYAYGYWLRKPT